MSVACEVEVRRDGRRASGRVEGGVARLLVPRADELEEIAVPEDLLPDALARLLDLGPRPVSPAAAPLRMTASALTAVLDGGGDEPAGLSGGGYEPVPAPDGTAAEQEALRGLLASGYVHWRVEVRMNPSTGGESLFDLEVLDTGGALWLLGFDPPEVELRPATSTAVFRRLAALVSGLARREGPADA